MTEHEILREVRIGLALEDCEADIDLPLFEKIDALFKEAQTKAAGCYFCDPLFNSCEHPFGMEGSHLCLECIGKLSNFVQALGIPPGMVFAGMEERKIQTTALVLEKGTIEVHQREV